MFKKLANVFSLLSFTFILFSNLVVVNVSAIDPIPLPPVPIIGTSSSTGGGNSSTGGGGGNTGGIQVPGTTALCKGATCPGGITDTKAQQFNDQNGIVSFISRIAQFLTFIAAAVAVIYMVWGGYNFITANGDEEKVKKGKDTLIYASVGLVVTIVAYTIVLLVSNVA
jgi:hypothetical protein